MSTFDSVLFFRYHQEAELGVQMEVLRVRSVPDYQLLKSVTTILDYISEWSHFYPDVQKLVRAVLARRLFECEFLIPSSPALPRITNPIPNTKKV